jgi:hypothetical protein
MVIIGGYETFVSKIRVAGHHDEPDWLSHVNANLLKVKLAVSIISISSIHLLKTFIEVGRMNGGLVKDSDGDVIYSGEGVLWEVVIHLAFIVSALALAWIDKMSHQHPRASRRTHLADQPLAAPPVTPAAASAAAPLAAPTPADGYVTVRLPAGTQLPAGAEVVDRPLA